jgi:hypothetical protein
MMIPTDGTEIVMHGVIVEDGKVGPAYLCDSDHEAEHLADEHRRQHKQAARPKRLIVSIREAE